MIGFLPTHMDGIFGWAVGAANVDVFDDGQTFCCKIPRSPLSTARLLRSPGVNAKLESTEYFWGLEQCHLRLRVLCYCRCYHPIEEVRQQQHLRVSDMGFRKTPEQEAGLNLCIYRLYAASRVQGCSAFSGVITGRNFTSCLSVRRLLVSDTPHFKL